MSGAALRITILGCGSSGGVPRIGGDWGACDPQNSRNRRRRCSILVERISGAGATQVLIDTSPDLREQLLSASIGRLDAVLYTHDHADHTHGLDDLRVVVYNRRSRLPVWMNEATLDTLRNRFSYAFAQPDGSPYPAILETNLIRGLVSIPGAGGTIVAAPFPVRHGGTDALGFRVGPVAYTPDISAMTDEAWRAVEGVDTWIVDALRYTPHPTHTHLKRTLGWIARAAPRIGVITNMHVDLDYERIEAETPENVHPAHDGMVLEFDV